MSKKLDKTLNPPQKLEENILTNYCAEAGLTQEDALYITMRAIEDLMYQAQDEVYMVLWEQDFESIDFEELSKKWASIFKELAEKVKELVGLFKEVKAQAEQKGGNSITMKPEEILEFVQSDEFDASKAEELVKTLIAKHGIKVEQVNEELSSQIAEINKSFEEMKKKMADYEEEIKTLRAYKEKTEAEKEQLKKDALAMYRMNDLEEAGITFSEERKEKVMKRLAEMDEEAYADYKEELLDITNKSKANTDQNSNQDDNPEGAQANNDDGNGDNQDDDYLTLARKVMAKRLNYREPSFVPQVEGDKNNSLYEKYVKLQKSINFEDEE